MKGSKYQQLLLEAYPGIEMLGYFDIGTSKAIANAVQSKDGIGDGLFCGGISAMPAAAVNRISTGTATLADALVALDLRDDLASGCGRLRSAVSGSLPRQPISSSAALPKSQRAPARSMASSGA